MATPSSDNSTDLSAIQYHITTSKAVPGAMVDHVQSEVAPLEQSHNSGSPIHKLPVELFSQILHLDIQSQVEQSTHALRLGELSHVSSWWRQIVEGAPELWTDIHWSDSKPPNVTARFLTLSNALPLNIKCIGPRRIQSENPPSLVEFVRMVAEHSHRWRSVHLEVAMTPEITQHLEIPTPNLRKIQLLSSLPETTHLLNFDATSPPLREVALTKVAIPWASSRLSGLKTLQLKEIEESDVSVELLRAFLQSSPILERLVLDDWSALSEGDKWQAAPNARSPIHLPSLTSLWLGDKLSSNIFDFLISTLHPGPLASLTLSMPTDSQVLGLDGAGWLSEPIRRLAGPMFLAAPTLKLRNDDMNGFLIIESIPQNEVRQWPPMDRPVPHGFSVDLDTHDMKATWTHACELLKTLGVTSSITIGIGLEDSSTVEDTFSLDILDELPTIYHIVIGNRHQVEPILGHVLRRLDQEDRRWACQNLQVIDLSAIRPQDLRSVDTSAFYKLRPDVRILYRDR